MSRRRKVTSTAAAAKADPAPPARSWRATVTAAETERCTGRASACWRISALHVHSISQPTITQVIDADIVVRGMIPKAQFDEELRRGIYVA